MDFFKSGPNYTKLKTNLRLVINRLKLLEKKRTEIALKSRVEIADYIKSGKIDRARIRVEHIVREDYAVEAMERLEMYADLLLARFGLIESMKEIDPGLEEAIASIFWATPRLRAEVAEFAVVSHELAAKYGKEFAEACTRNSLESVRVNEKLIHRMSIAAPPANLVEKYMIVIAQTYKVPYTPDRAILNEDDIRGLEAFLPHDNSMTLSEPPPPPSASELYSSTPGGGTHQPPPSQGGYQPPPQAPDHNTGPPPGIGFNLPDVPPAKPSGGDNKPPSGPPGNDHMDFDDLEARFNRLKKR